MSIHSLTQLKILGQLLERARIEAGLSHETLAKKLRLADPKNFRRFDERIGTLPSETLFELVTVLGVDPMTVMEILSPMEFPVQKAPDLLANDDGSQKEEPTAITLKRDTRKES